MFVEACVVSWFYTPVPMEVTGTPELNVLDG